MKEVYTPDQISERWGCDAKTVRGMLNDGKLQGFKVGKKLWRIRQEHLEEYECQTGQSPSLETNGQLHGEISLKAEQLGADIHSIHQTGRKQNAAPRLNTRN